MTRRAFLGAAALVPLAGCGTATLPARRHRQWPLPQRRIDSRPLDRLERRYDATLGVYAVDTATGATIAHRADERFNFCSTFKGLAAAAILAHHPLSYLDKRVTFTTEDLMASSVVTRDHVATGMTLREACDAAVRYSDGTAANLLLRELGGPDRLTAFTRSLGDRVFRMDSIEPTVAERTPGSPRNTTSPRAIGTDYRKVVLGNADELRQDRYKRLQPGARIGVGGLEETYDGYLRGRDGYLRQTVDAFGQPCDDPVDCPVREVEPRQGRRLQLTLDLGLERAATAALQRGIDAAAGNRAGSGAFVAMDPRNGAVLAMGSLPGYDANMFARPISQQTPDRLRSESSGDPLLDRATQGAYPTGSTFKLVSATAGLESGDITPGRIIDDRGAIDYGGQRFQNSGGTAYGPLDVVRAIVVSSDVFFYEVGHELYPKPGRILQTWARRFGFGHTTGIDLPGEFGGLVPDRRWRDAAYARTRDCVKRHRIAITDPSAPSRCFPFIDRPYSPGDNVNLAVGQGDLQATPLQLATAYSALANGGTLVRPHLGRAIEDDHRRLELRLPAPPRGKVGFSPATRGQILDGLRGATSAPAGTSTDVFAGFPYTVYGKTGTAEHLGQPDQSWYACYVADPARPIVVAVTIEKGGFGAATAAPVARLILSRWFRVPDTTFHSGESTTR